MAGSSSKPAPLQKSLSRRVSFNESSLKAKGRQARPPPSIDSIDTESQISSDNVLGGRRRRRGGCLSCCSSCCAWTALIVAILLTLALITGGTFFAYLQSNLPEVRLRRLDVNDLETSGDKVVSGNFTVLLNVTNGSGRVELGYRGMRATIAASGVTLGSVGLKNMHQQPHDTAAIVVGLFPKGLTVEEAAGRELVDENKMRILVVDVVVKGKIDFLFGGKKSQGWPFKIDCHSIDQSAIDSGMAPKCNTKLRIN